MIRITELEIYSDAGKYVRRIGTENHFKRSTRLAGDNAGMFEEVDGLPDEELKAAREKKTAEITAYDTSGAVNGFVLNGEQVWLDKATRVGLMNSTNIEKAAGHENTTLWLGGTSLTVDCDRAIGMLSRLELYALECYNVTAEHKAVVGRLRTVGEVEGYDHTAGYPEKPVFVI